MGENNKAKVLNFYKRWNMEYNQEERIKDFRNRVLITIDTIIEPIFIKSAELTELETKRLLQEYFKFIAVYIDDLFHYNTTIQIIFDRVIKPKFQEADLGKIIFYLQQFFNLDLDKDETIKNILYKEIKEDIDLSLLDIKIKKTKNGEYIFYPAGAKLLDEEVINYILDELDCYPESYKKFESALKKYQEQKYERNLIDDLRLSIELLLKGILKNGKSLDNQQDFLGKYLKDKGTPKEIRNMFTKLIDYYAKYQNENVKHNDKVRESEVEFMIYLTGTFMRFLLSL